MTYTQSAALATDEDFRNRVTFAVLNASVAIMNEQPDDTKPERAEKRLSLARQLITDVTAPEVFIRLCSANTTVSGEGTNAPDGDIDYVVASVWDAVAGVTYTDANPATPDTPSS